jgi:hypothetical protein
LLLTEQVFDALSGDFMVSVIDVVDELLEMGERRSKPSC